LGYFKFFKLIYLAEQLLISVNFVRKFGCVNLGHGERDAIPDNGDDQRIDDQS